MQKIALLTLTLVATAALVAERFVTAAGAQTGAGAAALGVARTKAAIGEAVPVDVIGTAIVESGGVFAVGDPIKADAQGRAIDQDGAGVILGRALQASTAAGERVEVLLIPS